MIFQAEAAHIDFYASTEKTFLSYHMTRNVSNTWPKYQYFLYHSGHTSRNIMKIAVFWSDERYTSTGYDRTCMLSPCDYRGPFHFMPCDVKVLQNFGIEREPPWGNGLPVPFNHTAAYFQFLSKASLGEWASRIWTWWIILASWIWATAQSFSLPVLMKAECEEQNKTNRLHKKPSGNRQTWLLGK